MGTSHGHFDGAAQGLLALDLGEIDTAVGRDGLGAEAAGRGGKRHERDFATQKTHGLIE